MEDTEIKVLATEFKLLKEQVERGFTDVKELIKASASNLNEHIKEDKERHDDLDEEIQALKIEMTKFKERWLLIGSGISIIGAFLVEMIAHALK